MYSALLWIFNQYHFPAPVQLWVLESESSYFNQLLFITFFALHLDIKTFSNKHQLEDICFEQTFPLGPYLSFVKGLLLVPGFSF